MLNREIKFRAWDKETNKFYNPIIADGKSLILSYDIVSDCDDPIMQYTGLKDKNGVEIYEGDFVKAAIFTGPFPEGLYVKEVIAKVKMEQSAFVLWVDYEEEYLLYNCHHSTTEVMGNIYEN